MAKITLAKALKLRKRVRVSLDSFRSVGLVYREEEGNKPTYRGFESFNDYFKNYLEASKVLVDLNTKIDEANVQKVSVTNFAEPVSVRFLLNTVENSKHLIPHYNNILSQKENYDKKPTAKEFNQYLYNQDTKNLGAYETVKYGCVVDMGVKELQSKIDEVVKTIRDAEDGISELNAKITIELSDETLAFIETL